jgi:hypothetical protein
MKKCVSQKDVVPVNYSAATLHVRRQLEVNLAYSTSYEIGLLVVLLGSNIPISPL